GKWQVPAKTKAGRLCAAPAAHGSALCRDPLELQPSSRTLAQSTRWVKKAGMRIRWSIAYALSFTQRSAGPDWGDACAAHCRGVSDLSELLVVGQPIVAMAASTQPPAPPAVPAYRADVGDGTAFSRNRVGNPTST